MKETKQTASAVPRKTALAMLAIGLILGTVFLFAVAPHYADVPREACTTVETELLSCRGEKSDRLLRSGTDLVLTCTEGTYRIDSAHVTKELADGLEALPPETPIALLLHPEEGTVLELCADGEPLLTLEDTMARPRSDRKNFQRLGLIMYGCAILGVFCLARTGKAEAE